MSHPHVIIDGIRVPIVSGGSDEGDLGSAAGSAMDRINEALGDSTAIDADLDPEGAAADPAPADAVDAGASSVGTASTATAEEMTYRDAQKLRQEQKEYRERWGAFEQAFQGLPDEAVAFGRQVLPLVARGNTDAAFVLGEYGDLHPDDRAIVDQIAEAVASNPQAAAAAFADVAAQLRGDAPEPDDEPDDDLDLDDGDPDGPQYLTPEDLDDRLGNFMERYAFQQAEQRELDSILAEVRDLGYDLTSEDINEQARVESLFALARRLDGDIGKAHEALQGQRQAIVDEYASGKAADAARPLPPSAGAPASGERRLETLEDGEAAMRARMDSMLR